MYFNLAKNKEETGCILRSSKKFQDRKSVNNYELDVLLYPTTSWVIPQKNRVLKFVDMHKKQLSAK